MKKTLVLFAAVSLLFFSGCTSRQQTSNEAASYQPSTEVLTELTNIVNNLNVSLMRGDAALAPTFEEYVKTVRTISTSLETTIKKFETEVAKIKVPEKITLNLIGLKSLANELKLALRHTSAAPLITYEDFYKTVQATSTGIEKIISNIEPANSIDTASTTTVTVMVPENMEIYRQRMTEYAQVGGIDPLPSTKFIQKSIIVPYTSAIVKASAEAAIAGIPLGGGPDKAFVTYLKVTNDTVYILLNIDIDGWAGSSTTLAIIHPIIEKTLLLSPEIKKVVFDYAPEDKTAAVTDNEKYCTSFGEVCPQASNCETCGVTQSSSYASCHSKEFCDNAPLQ